MGVWGGGFVTIINYGNGLGNHTPPPDITIETEAGLDILTESGVALLTE